MIKKEFELKRMDFYLKENNNNKKCLGIIGSSWRQRQVSL